MKSLNIDRVNSPIKIVQDDQKNKYYIISKYLDKNLQLDFCAKNLISFETTLDYFIQLLTILKNCYDNNFYVGDVHVSNNLIFSDKKAFLFDFDQSIFIKNNKI